MAKKDEENDKLYQKVIKYKDEAAKARELRRKVRKYRDKAAYAGKANVNLHLKVERYKESGQAR